VKGDAAAACGRVRWYINTSDINHEETKKFFEKHAFFGLPKDDVFFFPQQSLPALDLHGKLILESPGKIFMAPRGNGDLYPSMQRSGALKDLISHGVEYVHSVGVDNILMKLADPLFLGYCHENRYEINCKFITKVHHQPSSVHYSRLEKRRGESRCSYLEEWEAEYH
jgi:UDP-N-acetylglucosamine/UDP-N-acetylgalactosamine diphosphorylase